MKLKKLVYAISIILIVTIFTTTKLKAGQTPNYFSSGSSLVASGIISAIPTSLISIVGYNSSTSPVFLFIFDSATVPVDGSSISNGTAGFYVSIPGATSFSLDASTRGRVFLNGISFAVSTTAPSKTLGSAVVSLFAVNG